MRIDVGTSGFSYSAWRGSFYPLRLPARRMLEHYATVFPAVEINSSFRTLPEPDQLHGWASQVGPRFTFALKVPEQITHWKRLEVPRPALAKVATRAQLLGRRLGPLLFQLPPNFKKDLVRLEKVLDRLPAGVRASFEFRHPSWFGDDVYRLLRRHRAALCIAESDVLETPRVRTAPFGYLRLRKDRYRPKEIDGWAEWLLGQRWSRAFVFFKHEDTARGPRDARRLIRAIEAAKAPAPATSE